MSTIRDFLKKAIYYENRGYKEEARKYYRKVIGFEFLLNGDELERLAEFHYAEKDYFQALITAKQSISKLGNLNKLASIYLDSWEKTSSSLEELEWLLLQPGMDHLLEEKLRVAQHLFRLEKTDQAYLISLEVLEKTEQMFRINPRKNQLYVSVVLHILEMEYFFQNTTQARFHIRKLIYLKSECLYRYQDIAYWSIVLDEVAALVTRQDWEAFEAQLSGDILWICQLYRKIYKRRISPDLGLELKRRTFRDPLLEQKRQTYVALIKRMFKDDSWVTDIEEQMEILPHDLLTSLLYTEKSKEGSVSFWKQRFIKHADRPEAIKAYWKISKRERNRKSLENVRVTFIGGGEKIGGTSILVSIRDHHILLDAGMHLHEEMYHPDYTILQKLGVSFDDIDALLISHAHLDHTGAVPYVHQQSPQMPIYATEATKNLMKVLLRDTVKLSNRNDVAADMYDENQLQEAMLSIRTVLYHESFVIPSKDKEWKVTYIPSGHILGAAAIHLEIEGVSILFTGDYSIEDQRSVQGLRLPRELTADVLITESTYGYTPMNISINRLRQEQLLIESVIRTTKNGGNMLIPAFAVGRAQEIILILKEAFKNEAYLPFNLFLDGRVTEVCRIYQNYADQRKFLHPSNFNGENNEQLFFGNGVRSAQDIYSNQRESLYTFQDFIEDYILPGNNCIIASSGMLIDQSASARYAEYLVEYPHNTISFTGYLDEESPGSHLLHMSKSMDDETIKINGVEKTIQAKVESFRLSAHASREEIVQLTLDIQPQVVFLMHGEHQKRYQPLETTVEGNVIYPTVIDLLKYVEQEIKVISAFNGESYQLGGKYESL